MSGQVSLLRFLQDKSYQPLGGGNKLTADVRVVAACNRNLQALVAQGLFRQDLMFRLNVVSLTMPALRDRPGDIPLIAEHYMKQFQRKYGDRQKQLDTSFYHWLEQQHWPGNVRELENLLLRHFLLSESDIIYPPAKTHMPPESAISVNTTFPLVVQRDTNISLREAKTKLINSFEKHYIMNTLEKSSGNVSEAARIAGKERRAFGKLMKKYGLDRNQFLS